MKMREIGTKRRLVLAGAGAVISGLSASSLSAQVATSTVTFQNGVNGYTGTVNRLITASAPDSSTDGSTIDTSSSTNSFFVDGGTTTLNDSGANHALLRFDNIVGASAIPANAVIISASLTLKTTAASASQTNGAYNLYPLANAFDATTTWNNYGGSGPGTNGHVGPLLANFMGMTAINTVTSARVDRSVQSWVNGGSNLGLGIRSDSTLDGWSFNPSGTATVADRPKLSVTYTTDANARSIALQQGVSGYTGIADSFPNGSGATTGTKVNGNTLVAAGTIDGTGGGSPASSPDQPYFLRFNNLDLTSYTSILKAELILKTSSASNSNTGGTINVHQLLRDWSTSTTYAQMDSDGNPSLNEAPELLAHGDIGPAAASVSNAALNQFEYIDVTSIVDNWRTGQPNYGFYFFNTSTDAWGIYTSGASDPGLTPELRIIGVVPEPASAGLLLVAAGGLLSRRRRVVVSKAVH